MAKFLKLPNKLKAWKISSLISDNKGNETYKVSKRDYDGTVINGILRHISVSDEEYNDDYAKYIDEETDFLKLVSGCGNSFNYLDIYSEGSYAKKKNDLYIITEDLPSLSEIMKSKTFSEDEVINFGIQMSAALEALEAKNIFHSNITPDNIFVAKDGSYKLGGFSDLESKVSDFSFAAPEIYRKEKADFTTDIYSLGLIMYAMCNNGVLPFEKDGVKAKDALKTRLDGSAVSAPVNGSEKLKSIIVIACQPKNSNRWKNASNIKNALTSISNEKVVEDKKAEAKIIAPEKTDFDSNMFEEYDYDEPENELTDESSAEETTDENTEAAFESTVPSEEAADNNAPDTKNEETEVDEILNEQSVSKTLDDNKPENDSLPEDEVKNDVFDNYEVRGNKKQTQNNDVKDYGTFFDDEPKDEKVTPLTSNSSDEETEKISDDVDIFSDDDNSLSNEKNEKGKKNILLPIICAIVIIAALGFVAYCIFNAVTKNNDDNNTKATVAETSTAQLTTTPVTTAPPTTVAPTTKEKATETPQATVISVIGYGYDDAKWLLEDAGFNVEEGEYRYSDEYDEGYVISQSPEKNTTADKGTTVTLDISLGSENNKNSSENSKTESSNTSQKTNNTFIFPNSDSAYLSSSDVKALSYDDLETAINEIYARRGREFVDPDIAAYFNSQSWYTPKYSPAEFDKYVEFNTYEQKNLQLLVDERKNR